MTTFDRLKAQATPAYADLSPHLYVAFPVRRFRHARVAWLNRRWFAANGMDLGDRAVCGTLEDWLLSRYAVAAPGCDDPPDQYLDAEAVLYADRYGSPSGAVHGGSGRVGTWGAFNAKGVGRTPLASTTSDWYHSHGCMFLEEAVREAILSEVAACVFPHGAVPTVAVIDVGARLRWGDGSYGARRAILVRPSFLRIAGLMRSIYFGTSGYAGADQVEDAACVRDMWARLDPASWLIDSFGAVGQQYGYGNALRLWPGPLFASNVALDGRLVDFGSFRALPNWKRAQGGAREHGFGGETALADAAARSLERNGRRHGAAVDADVLVEAFRRGANRGFENALVAKGMTPGSTLVRTLMSVRSRQQGEVTDLRGGEDVGVTIGTLRPQPWLARETLLARTEEMIDGLDEGPDRDVAPVARFIDGYAADAAAGRAATG